MDSGGHHPFRIALYNNIMYLYVWQCLFKLSDFLHLQIVDSHATTAAVP